MQLHREPTCSFPAVARDGAGETLFLLDTGLSVKCRKRPHHRFATGVEVGTKLKTGVVVRRQSISLLAVRLMEAV